VRDVAARLARNVVWLGTGEVLLKGALFTAGVVVARGLGPAAMGAFTVAYGAAVVLTLVLAAGQPEVLIRETARSPETASLLNAISGVWRRHLAIVVLPVTAIGGMLVADRVLRWVLLAFIPYAWLRSALISVGASFKGLDRMEVEVEGRAVELGVALLLLVSFAGVAAPVWTTGVAFSAGAASGLVVVRRQLRGLPCAENTPVTRTFLAREGAIFLFLGLSVQASLRIDTFMLAGFGVAKEEIGRYGVAGALVWGLLGASQLLAVAMYPTISKAAASGNLRLTRVLGIALGGAVLGTMLAALLTAFRGPIVRLVFGPQYAASERLVGVLAWALPSACVAMMLGVVVAACGRQGWSLVNQCVVVAASAAGNFLAIPRWGTAGCAAIAVVAWGVALVGSAAVVALALRKPKRTEVPVAPGTEWE
jgi:O-antigen/teichoic acid export membrane protein